MFKNKLQTFIGIDGIDIIVNSEMNEILKFCQKMIQTPSPSGNEENIAKLVLNEMKYLKFDEVWTDIAGNVIGVIKGGKGHSLMLNGHLDHVIVGSQDAWSVPQYEGRIQDGYIWGSGSVDMKCTVAAQIYTVGLLKRLGYKFPGDIYVTCVVMEEVGGLGTRKLIEDIKTDYAIVGESTNNNIALSHRGRLEIIVEIEGRSAHAGMPELGVNPHYSMARFLLALKSLEMVSDVRYGKSTVAPTLYSVDQKLSNVIPRLATLYLDWRNIPSEKEGQIIEKLNILLENALDLNAHGNIRLFEKTLQSYTGYSKTVTSSYPGFSVEPNNPLIKKAQEILSQILGSIDFIRWGFTTDAPHLSNAGILTFGFGPGDASMYHTIDERLCINELEKSIRGYIALTSKLGIEEIE
jgi:succinyl-diaminopimelate desuccinylase